MKSNETRKTRYNALIQAGVSPAIATKIKDRSQRINDDVIKITKLRDIDYFDNMQKITGIDFRREPQ